MPGARCTRGLVCRNCAFGRTRAYRAAETLRHPLRNGFTAYFVLSPVSGLFCHRHLAENLPQGLAPASRRQDHTTSPYAFVHSSALARLNKSVHRIPRPTYVTTMIRPSIGTGRASYNSDFQNCEAKYF